jgi:hypothetical protein
MKTELYGQFLRNRSVRQNKVYFNNNEWMQGRNEQDTADLNLIRINEDDYLELGILPIYDDVIDAATPNNALVNKAYVLGVLAGLRDPKDAVRAASIGNIDLASMPANVDGVTLDVGDRFLAKNQTDAIENGIYVYDGAGQPAVRSEDADEDAEVNQGMSALVAEGSVNARRQYMLSTPDPIVVDTTALTFVRIPNPSDLVIEQEEIIELTDNDLDDNGYVDLTVNALQPSIEVTPIGGVLQEKDEAYTLSVESGVTRITFGTSATSGSLGELLKEIKDLYGTIKLSVIYERLAN